MLNFEAETSKFCVIISESLAASKNDYCVYRNRLIQSRIICSWYYLTITMMLNLIELSRFIQEVPRLTVITRETIEIFNRLRNANVDQIRLLEQKIREGCQWCTHPVVVQNA
jgi:hypothetical protein